MVLDPAAVVAVRNKNMPLLAGHVAEVKGTFHMQVGRVCGLRQPG